MLSAELYEVTVSSYRSGEEQGKHYNYTARPARELLYREDSAWRVG